jgi:hypothetical protein
MYENWKATLSMESLFPFIHPDQQTAASARPPEGQHDSEPMVTLTNKKERKNL